MIEPASYTSGWIKFGVALLILGPVIAVLPIAVGYLGAYLAHGDNTSIAGQFAWAPFLVVFTIPAGVILEILGFISIAIGAWETNSIQSSAEKENP